MSCAVSHTRRTGWIQSILQPSSSLTKTLLAQFPEGYRHLAYLQTKIGYEVKRDMPGLDGPDLDALYAKGEAWLKGRKLS